MHPMANPIFVNKLFGFSRQYTIPSSTQPKMGVGTPVQPPYEANPT